ncbi:MAG: glycosyltransferase N-terminal domain-containing protein [Gemmatimonadales bacterium]
MTLAPPWPYRMAVATAVPLLRAAGLASSGIAGMVRGRDQSRAAFRDWARTRDRSAPLLLVHAPSAGEWRQADPVIDVLRSFRHGLQFACTYTSPSAVPVVEEIAPEVHGFLPWDRPGDVAELLDTLKPDLLVVTKLDLWPELALQARARGIPIVLIAATVRERSNRLRGAGRLIVRTAYESVTLALAVSPEDAVRLAALGVSSDRISVVGDPRYDSVLERIAGVTASPVPGLLVAGSTWPGDERVLLRAFAQVRRAFPDPRLLIVPHRPAADDLDRLTRLASRYHLPWPEQLALSPPPSANAWPTLSIVSRVGGLARWFGLGEIAYVGGGYGRGLHSVLEPAAWGLPVVVGPRWRGNADAEALEQVQALTPLELKRPVEQLANHWTWLLENPGERHRTGAAARALVEARAGAATVVAGFVLEALQTKKGRD